MWSDAQNWPFPKYKNRIFHVCTLSLHLSLPENPKQHDLHNLHFFPGNDIPRVWALIIQVPSRSHLLYQRRVNFPQWNSPLLCSLYYWYSLGDIGGFASGHKNTGRAGGAKLSLNASLLSHLTRVLLMSISTPAQSFNFYLVQKKPEIPHEINQIRNSSAPRIMGWFAAFSPPRFGTPPKCQWKSACSLTLIVWACPAMFWILREYRTYQTSFYRLLSAREVLEPVSQRKLQECRHLPKENEGQTSPNLQSSVCWVPHQALQLQKITGQWEKSRRKIQFNE